MPFQPLSKFVLILFSAATSICSQNSFADAINSNLNLEEKRLLLICEPAHMYGAKITGDIILAEKKQSFGNLKFELFWPKQKKAKHVLNDVSFRGWWLKHPWRNAKGQWKESRIVKARGSDIHHEGFQFLNINLDNPKVLVPTSWVTMVAGPKFYSRCAVSEADQSP